MAAEVAPREQLPGEGTGRQKSRSSEKPGPSPRTSLLALLLLILVALALRVLRLQFQPLWWDEGYSVWFATHTLGQMVALTSLDIHPPLYYALLHGWMLLAGTDPLALRLFSVVAGTLAVPAIYLAGREMLGLRSAWLAALLLAINPLHVYYSQEVRMYGLVTLLGLGALLAAWRLLDESVGEAAAAPRPTRPWVAAVLYVLFTSAALYTQYYAAFLPLGLTLYAGWRWQSERRALLRWLGLQAVVALLYLPWLLYATPKLIPYIGNKVQQDADRPLGPIVYLGQHLAAFAAGHLEGPLAPYWPLALAPLVLWVVCLVASQIGGRRRTNGVTGPEAAGALQGRRARVADGKELSSGRCFAGDSPRPALPGLSAQHDRTGDSAQPALSSLPAQHDRPEDPPQPALRGRPARHHRGRTLFSGTHRRGQASALTVLVVVLLTILLAGFVVSLRYPFFPERGERLLLLGLPPFLLILAAGLEGLWRRGIAWISAGLGLMALLAAVSLYAFYTVPRYSGDDYRGLVARTVQQGTADDTVLCIYPWQVGYWRSYGSPDGPTAVLAPSTEWGQELQDALDAALSRGHLWFPAHLSTGAGTESRVEDYLGQKALLFGNEWYGPGTRLSAWAAPGAGPAQVVRSSSLRFALAGNPLTLVGAAGEGGPIPAANTVAGLTLTWRAAAAPTNMAVSVRLVDSLGRLWAQNDYQPLGANDRAGPRQIDRAADDPSGWQAQDVLGLLIPAGTPPGQYDLEVAVRPADSQEALEITATDGSRLGQASSLFPLVVGPAGHPVGPERLPIASYRPLDLGDGLRFLGYTYDAAAVAPGEERKVTLFWQATGTPEADYKAFVQLLDERGGLASNWEEPPGAGYATSRWSPGTLIRTQASFRPRAGLADGSYALVAGLFRPSNGDRLQTAGGSDHLALGEVSVRGRMHDTRPPAPMHATDVLLGNNARLLGYDVAAPEGGYQPGASFGLTLYWQARDSSERPYAVFAHVLAEDGTIYGIGDAQPGGGKLPTTGWLPNEYLRDEHTITIDAGAPPGRYRLVAGMYDPATGLRLTTPDGLDQVVLDDRLLIREPAR